MTSQRQLAAAAITVALLLTGCSSSSQASAPAPTPPRESARPSPSSAPSPSPSPTERDVAIAQAKQAITRYYQVTDAIANDPTMSLDALKQVATGTALITVRGDADYLRSRSERAIGNTGVADMTVTDVDLQLDKEAYPPRIPTVLVDVCYDVSGVSLVDKNGKSAVEPNRADRSLEKLGVVNYDYPSPSGWTIGFTTAQGKPCSA